MFDRRAKLAFIIASLTLVIGGVGFRAAVHQLNVFLRKEPVELRRSLTLIPKRLGDWEAAGRDVLLDEAVIETLGTREYLNRTYVKRDGSGDMLQVHMAYYTGMIDTVPHVPDRCFLAGGMGIEDPPENLDIDVGESSWAQDPNVRSREGEPYPTVFPPDPVTNQPRVIRMPFGDVQCRVTQFTSDADPDVRIQAGYFFIANGRTTPQPGDVKLLAFDPREQYAYYCKVQFTGLGDRDYTQEAFLSQVEDLAPELLPEVMWCLPDWPSYEQVPSSEVRDSRES